MTVKGLENISIFKFYPWKNQDEDQWDLDSEGLRHWSQIHNRSEYDKRRTGGETYDREIFFWNKHKMKRSSTD